MGKWIKYTTMFLLPSFIGLIIISCAKQPEEISPMYVSPLQYQHYTCEQIQEEMARIVSKLSELYRIQQKEHNKDVVAFSVGMFLFWPALFFMMGEEKKEEIAKLKGEYEALEKAAIRKNCSFVPEMEKQKEEMEKRFKEEQKKQEKEETEDSPA